MRGTGEPAQPVQGVIPVGTAELVEAVVPVGRTLDTAAVSDQTWALLAAGVPAETRRAYAQDRAAWRAYAALRGLPPLPVDALALADYAATLLMEGNPAAPVPRPLSVTTVERRVSSVATWAREQGHAAPDLRPARLVLRGQRRTAPMRPRQAAPVTVEALRALVGQAMAGAPWRLTARAARDRCVVLLGFALAARRSELVRVRVEDVCQHPDGLLVQVHRAKTRDHPDAVPVTWASDPALCPVRAVRSLRQVLAERGFEQGPLFRRVTRSDAMLRHGLAPEAVADIVQRLAKGAGLAVPDGFGSWAGHSLRRGGATEARRAGASQWEIARWGGWSDNSTSLSRYCASVDAWKEHPLRGVL